MKRFLSGPIVAMGLAVLGGCAQEPAPICNMNGIADQRQLVAVPSMIPNGISPVLEMPLNSVSIVDKDIINKVFVRAVTTRRTPTGTVEVASQVINCTDYPLNAEARVQFYDEAQVPSEPVSAWKRFALPPRTSNTYRESSVGTKSAQYYMVEMRETK